jgi:hypothetical protein
VGNRLSDLRRPDFVFRHRQSRLAASAVPLRYISPFSGRLRIALIYSVTAEPIADRPEQQIRGIAIRDSGPPQSSMIAPWAEHGERAWRGESLCRISWPFRTTCRNNSRFWRNRTCRTHWVACVPVRARAEIHKNCCHFLEISQDFDSRRDRTQRDNRAQSSGGRAARRMPVTLTPSSCPTWLGAESIDRPETLKMLLAPLPRRASPNHVPRFCDRMRQLQKAAEGIG